MKTVLKLLAQSSPGLEKYLQEELKMLGLKPASAKGTGINGWEMISSQEKFFDILHKCRTIEDLKIQIGPKVLARGEKELERNLRRLPWQGFYPFLDLSKNYKEPEIKVVSVKSKLYHERKIAEIIKKFIYVNPVRRQWAQLRKLGIKNFNRELETAKYLIEEQKSESKLQQLPATSLKKNEKKEIVSAEENTIERPKIYVVLHRDVAKVFVKINKDSMHKHGFKKKVGWGPIKENIVCACLLESDIFQRALNDKALKVWDPFCGSGTILLELFSLMKGIPIRTDSSLFYLESIPAIDYDAYKEYKRKLLTVQEQNPGKDRIALELLGSDIAEREPKSAASNFKTYVSEVSSDFLKNPSQVCPLGASSLREIPFLKIYKAFENVNFVLGDFEAVGKEVITDLQDFTIFTSIPFGIRSKEELKSNELTSLYRRFSNFLRRNLKKLKEVYVIYPRRDKFRKDEFFPMSEMKWEAIQEFKLGGIPIALYKLSMEQRKTERMFELTLRVGNFPKPYYKFKALSPEEKKALLERREKERTERKEKLYEENKNLLIKANEEVSKIKFDKQVINDKGKMKQLIRRKKEEFVRRKKYIDLLQGRAKVLSDLKKKKREKSEIKRELKQKKLVSLGLENLDDLSSEKKENLLKNLQTKLDQKAARKTKKLDEFFEAKRKENKKSPLNKW